MQPNKNVKSVLIYTLNWAEIWPWILRLSNPVWKEQDESFSPWVFTAMCCSWQGNVQQCFVWLFSNKTKSPKSTQSPGACGKKKKKKNPLHFTGENLNKVFGWDNQRECFCLNIYTTLLSPTAKINVIKESCTMQMEGLDRGFSQDTETNHKSNCTAADLCAHGTWTYSHWHIESKLQQINTFLFFPLSSVV